MKVPDNDSFDQMTHGQNLHVAKELEKRFCWNAFSDGSLALLMGLQNSPTIVPRLHILRIYVDRQHHEKFNELLNETYRQLAKPAAGSDS